MYYKKQAHMAISAFFFVSVRQAVFVFICKCNLWLAVSPDIIFYSIPNLFFAVWQERLQLL